MSVYATLKTVFEKYKKFFITAGAIYPTLLAVASDFLKPLFNSTIWLLAFIAIIAAAEFAFYRLGKTVPIIARVNSRLAHATDGKWFLPYFIASLMVLCIFSVTYLLNEDDQDGFLAEHIHLLANLQKQIGVANKKLDILTDKTDETNAKIDILDSKISNLKKESSDNPRKELMNMGIAWNEENYFKAIWNADLPALELFWKGGMDPMAMQTHTVNYGNTIKYPYIASVPYVFLAITPANPNWEKLANIYLENKFFTLNEQKYEFYMPKASILDRLADYSQDNLMGLLMQKYSAATLIMLNSMTRVRPPDTEEVLHYLAAHGADLNGFNDFWEAIIILLTDYLERNNPPRQIREALETNIKSIYIFLRLCDKWNDRG